MEQGTSSWSSLLGFMWQLYDQQMLCDVMVLTQDAQIGSHKLILGAVSDTLHAFFLENSVKNQVSKPIDIKNKNISSPLNKSNKTCQQICGFSNDKTFYQKDYCNAMNLFDKNISIETCKKRCESPKFKVPDNPDDDKYLNRKCLIKSQFPRHFDNDCFNVNTLNSHNFGSKNPSNHYLEDKKENCNNVIISQNTCFEKYKSYFCEKPNKVTIPVPKPNNNPPAQTSYNNSVNSSIIRTSLQFHKREFTKLRKLEEQQKMKLDNLAQDSRHSSFRPLKHLEKRMSRISSEKPKQDQYIGKVSGLRRNYSSKTLRLSEYEIKNESQNNEEMLSKLSEAIERVEARKSTQKDSNKEKSRGKESNKSKNSDVESLRREAVLNKFFDALTYVGSSKSSKESIETFQNSDRQSQKNKVTDSEFQKKESLLSKFVDALEYVESRRSSKNKIENIKTSDTQPENKKDTNSVVQNEESLASELPKASVEVQSINAKEDNTINKFNTSNPQPETKKDTDDIRKNSSPQKLSADLDFSTEYKSSNEIKSKSTYQLSGFSSSSKNEQTSEVIDDDLSDRNNNQNDPIVQFIPQILASRNSNTNKAKHSLIRNKLIKNKSYVSSSLLPEKVNNFLYKPDAAVRSHNDINSTKTVSPTKRFINNNLKQQKSQKINIEKPGAVVSECFPRNNGITSSSPLMFTNVSLKSDFSQLPDKKTLRKYERRSHIQSFRTNNVNKNAKSTSMFDQDISNSASDISINLSCDSTNAYDNDTHLLLPTFLNHSTESEDRFSPQKTIEMFAVDEKTMNSFKNSLQDVYNSNKNNNQSSYQNEQYSYVSIQTDDVNDNSFHQNVNLNHNMRSKNNQADSAINSTRRKNHRSEDDFYINFLLNRAHQPTKPYNEKIYEDIKESEFNQNAIESNSNIATVFLSCNNIQSQKHNLRHDFDTPDHEELSDGFHNTMFFDENRIKVIESSSCFQDQEFNIDIEGCENFNNKITFKEYEDDNISNNFGKLKLDVVNNDNYNSNNNNNNNHENKDVQKQKEEGVKQQNLAKRNFLDVLNSKSFINSINFVKRNVPKNVSTQKNAESVGMLQPNIQKKPNLPRSRTTTSTQKTITNHNYNNKNLENPSQEHFIISMQNYSTQTVCCLLRFMYTGDASVIVNSNLRPLLHISLELKISPLHRCCISFIVSTMQPCNVAGYLLLVDAYKMINIKKVLFCHLLQNISEVLRETEFFELPLEWIVIILGDVGSRRLIYAYCNELSEEEVELMIFDGIVKWIDYERSKRMCHAPKLLSEVAHLEALSTKSLMEAVDSVDWLFKNQNIQEIVLNIYKKKLLGDSVCMKSADIPEEILNGSPDGRVLSHNCSMLDCCTEEVVEEDYCPHYFMPEKLRSSFNSGNCSHLKYI